MSYISPNFSKTAALQKGETDLGTSQESDQTHSEKNRLDFLALRGENLLETKKKTLFAT